MKLFMAYSAYDEIRAAERILLKLDRNKTHKYKNEILAEKIRSNERMKDLLLETIAVEEDGLRVMLKKFYANKNNEIMIFASSLRHSFVHGDFTTARSGLTNKREIQTINDVTDVVLKISDEIFSEISSIPSEMYPNGIREYIVLQLNRWNKILKRIIIIVGHGITIKDSVKLELQNSDVQTTLYYSH
jgi:hypothetical protein